MKCNLCGQEAAVRDVEFQIEIGLLLAGYRHTKKGLMCPACIRSTFWKYTLTTLAVGWWSIPSLFLNPLVVVMNIINYRVKSLSPAYAAEPAPVVLDGALVEKLRPFQDEIFSRLFKGENKDQVFEDIGNRTGATAAEVRAFYNSN
jgi:hypothetical protein